MDSFVVEIVTPIRVVNQEDVKYLRCPGIDGSFGVMKNHRNGVIALDVGEIKIILDQCVSSKLAALLGIRIDATAFSHKPVDEICKMLKKAGFSEDGKEVMYHPYTGKRLKGRVFIGPTFYQRLKHMVEDKIHARAKGKIVGLTRQPVDGRANGGGLRWGEMERDCGVAHGASAYYMKE